MVSKTRTDGGIERLDLACPTGQKIRTKGLSSDFRKLEELHRSATNDFSVRVVPDKKLAPASTTNATSDSSLPKHSEGLKSNTQPSSEYSDEWNLDLPSLTGILEEVASPISAEERRDTKAPPSSDAIAAEEDLVDDEPGVEVPSEDLYLPHYDAEFSDTEQALIGLSDTISLLGNSP